MCLSYICISCLFRNFSKNISLFLSLPIAISLSKSHCLCLRDLCPAGRRHVFVLDTRPLTSQARSVTVGLFGGTKAPRVEIEAASCPASPRAAFNVGRFWVSVKRENANIFRMKQAPLTLSTWLFATSFWILHVHEGRRTSVLSQILKSWDLSY